MNRFSLQFAGPHEVRVAEERIAQPAADQVVVRTVASGISPGTELLVYRNQWPPNVPLDATIPALAGELVYPLSYGYAAVGRVIEVGSKELVPWMGELVFSFNPHQSHFLARPAELVAVPPSLSPDEAVLLPNMETAVCLVMDGRPTVGECVIVIGQGIVGLLTTSLLTRFPLGCLVTVDRYERRRQSSLALGATVSLDPSDPERIATIADLFAAEGSRDGADLTYELSGNPSALDRAIETAGFCGRIVVGSWYGSKRANVDLGGRFHRNRIRLIGSQVSSIAPELTGRWSKSRRFPLMSASEAYELLDLHPEEAIQVIFEYEE
jgi:2-desacetyl-2-hydroxyethyl bacteriochlorophyllide A dehydrogenase